MSDKPCPRIECSCLVAGQCKSDLYSTCKIKFAPITAIAPVIKPAITNEAAKAAYNTLRDYCKQHKGCVGCRYCDGTGDTKCIFEFDYHEYGVLAPADWSGE